MAYEMRLQVAAQYGGFVLCTQGGDSWKE